MASNRRGTKHVARGVRDQRISSLSKKASLPKSRGKTGRSSEIAGLRAALQEKELLLKEIHHRIKNNLQIIASLLRLQASQLDDDRLREAMLVCQSRIRSIALIHEKLYQSSDLAAVDFGEYLRSLASEIIRLFATDESLIHLEVRTRDVRLPTKKAVSCGLIVSELLVNALKHAFPPGRAGTIVIEMTPRDRGGIDLVIADDGVGLPADFDARKARSLGLHIVSDLVKQLDGEMRMETSGGAVFRITF